MIEPRPVHRPCSPRAYHAPRALLLLCLAALLAGAAGSPMAATAAELAGSQPAKAPEVQIGLFQTLELVFAAGLQPPNPFDTYLLKVQLTDPTGDTFALDGFYDGNGSGGQEGTIWKARVSPYEIGIWSWEVVPGDLFDASLVGLSGSFEVTPSTERGGVVREGRYFRFDTGDPIYLVGNFLDYGDDLTTTHVFMSEAVGDEMRDAIIARQSEFHTANKANMYFANKGDYGAQPVTPWPGTASNNDKSRMDLSRWHLYDTYIQRLKENKLLAEMWFFADDSDFGDLPAADRNRLLRYAMARTSAFNHTLYVLALEWQEGFSAAEVSAMGDYLQAHNPWHRLLSVHNTTRAEWQFGGEAWPTFIASQAGNQANPWMVNDVAVGFWQEEPLPHLDEEFGHLDGDTDVRVRGNLWANFCGGAAGSGTGSDLKALQRLIAQSRVPFQRMGPANELIEDGGGSRFVLAEVGHHYVAYSSSGSFTLEASGAGLQGQWFDPRDPDATLGAPFAVAPGSQTFTPPEAAAGDWVLWITDGSNLTGGITHPTNDTTIVTVYVTELPPPPPPPPPMAERLYLPVALTRLR